MESANVFASSFRRSVFIPSSTSIKAPHSVRLRVIHRKAFQNARFKAWDITRPTSWERSVVDRQTWTRYTHSNLLYECLDHVNSPWNSHTSEGFLSK